MSLSALSSPILGSNASSHFRKHGCVHWTALLPEALCQKQQKDRAKSSQQHRLQLSNSATWNLHKRWRERRSKHPVPLFSFRSAAFQGVKRRASQQWMHTLQQKGRVWKESRESDNRQRLIWRGYKATSIANLEHCLSEQGVKHIEGCSDYTVWGTRLNYSCSRILKQREAFKPMIHSWHGPKSSEKPRKLSWGRHQAWIPSVCLYEDKFLVHWTW